MLVVLLSIFIVPVLYCLIKEIRLTPTATATPPPLPVASRGVT